MSDTGDKSQKEKDNLSRIRDNQRRSRARRKEYVGQLETKLRDCEQKGVGATTEVQAAAKQVLVENKRLRALLRHKGVSDAEVDAFQLNGQSNGGTYDSIPASMSLEAMLRHRYPCGSDEPGTTALDMAAYPTGTLQSSCTGPQCFTPGVMAPDTPTDQESAQTGDLSTQQSRAQPNEAVWHAGIMSADVLAFQGEASSAGLQAPLGMAASADKAQHGNWGQVSVSQQTNTNPASSCSCAEAAIMIRSMGGEPDPSLNRELGCDANDPQCRASSLLVFDLLDRYAQSGLGS